MSKPLPEAVYVERWWKNLHAKAKVDANGCWIWQGYIHPTGGYGQTHIRGEGNIHTHRAVWIMKHGPLRKDQHVCHSCDVRLCCNPDHLWLGSNLDNVRDMQAKGRHYRATQTHCKHGHEFTPQNTRVYRGPIGDFRRICRECQRLIGRGVRRPRAGSPKDKTGAERIRRYRARLKQAAA